MSKSVGIIAEYNPFHTGHKYQIDYLKSKGYSDIRIAMSGTCVQRGEISMLSKFTRATMAIENGASLVAEIPYPFSRRSAEGFANAGIQTLKALGVDAISFGSECADEKLLLQIAEYLLTGEYENKIQEYTKEKLPFAVAREKAIFSKFQIDKSTISARNDILAIEYLKSCIKLNWKPVIEIVKRHGARYNDTRLIDRFASASGIRKAISQNRLDTIESFIPQNSIPTFENDFYHGSYFLPDDTAFEKAILFTLRQKSYEDFLIIEDCNTELAHAFEKAVSISDSIGVLFDNLPTKHYTRARLNRIILSAFLNCSQDIPKDIQYVRILGIDKTKEDYLKKVGGQCPLPISHSAKILSEKSDLCKRIAAAESSACDAQSSFFKISGAPRKDYTTKFIKR